MFTQKAESIPTTTTRKVVMTKQGDERKYSCSNEMEDDKLTVTVRKEAPTHYTLEIESFPILKQILSKSGLDRYESPEFQASSYKWRLILYPEGDKKRKGDGHISLYLEIVGIQKLGYPWEIDALLNFFVYDHKKNQYISIQDGRVKRFSAVKTECGFSRLLPLTEFTDTDNGYLSGHESRSCMFGVEVFVLKSEGKGECLFTLDNPPKNLFIWKIEKFSKLSKESFYSNEFTIGDYKWKLRFYPKGVEKVNGEFLSIYLHLQDYQKILYGSKMYVEFKLRINYEVDGNPKKTEKTGNAWFSGFETARAWGFPCFVKQADLQLKEGLIYNDEVLVEAEISSMSMTKDLSTKDEE